VTIRKKYRKLKTNDGALNCWSYIFHADFCLVKNEIQNTLLIQGNVSDAAYPFPLPIPH